MERERGKCGRFISTNFLPLGIVLEPFAAFNSKRGQNCREYDRLGIFRTCTEEMGYQDAHKYLVDTSLPQLDSILVFSLRLIQIKGPDSSIRERILGENVIGFREVIYTVIGSWIGIKRLMRGYAIE